MNGPNVWNIGDPIYINLFVANPNDDSGIEGIAANITLNIQRVSDDLYWTGSAWSASPSNLTLTDKSNGRYLYTISSTGNYQAETYVVYARVDYPPLLDGAENYEIHTSRLLDVRVYESEPA